MNTWPVWAWAWWGLSAALLCVALYALYRGLWRDPGAGRRRCHRCWYEMEGIAGLRCPECGRSARHERSLHRRRRSWRWAFVGVVLAGTGWGVGLLPRIVRDGWWTVTPTPVLIELWPEWLPAGVTTRNPVTGFANWVNVRSEVASSISRASLPAWARQRLLGKCLWVLDHSPSDAPEALLLLGPILNQRRLVLWDEGSRAGPGQPDRELYAALARHAGSPTANTASMGAEDLEVIARLAEPSPTHVGALLAPGKNGTLAEYWSDITGLPVSSGVVERLVRSNAPCVFLIPDRFIIEHVRRGEWIEEVGRALAQGAPPTSLERADRVRGLADAFARMGSAAAPFWREYFRAGSAWESRHAILVRLLEEGPGVQGALEQAVTSRTTALRELRWLRAIVLKHGPAGPLEEYLFLTLESEPDALRQESAELAGRLRVGSDRIVLKLAELAALDRGALQSDTMQATTVEALGRLARVNPRSRGLLEHLKEHGPTTARFSAATELRALDNDN